MYDTTKTFIGLCYNKLFQGYGKEQWLFFSQSYHSWKYLQLHSILFSPFMVKNMSCLFFSLISIYVLTISRSVKFILLGSIYVLVRLCDVPRTGKEIWKCIIMLVKWTLYLTYIYICVSSCWYHRFFWFHNCYKSHAMLIVNSC